VGPLLALAIVIVCFGVANQLKNGSDSTFFTAENARTIAAPTATIVVAALGMTLIVIAGGHCTVALCHGARNCTH
jgi:ribose/xylose/arabinose/galactoside ABC-type transport system permease subunit